MKLVKKINLFAVIILAVSNCVYSAYSPVTYEKKVIANTPDVNYYGVCLSESDPLETGAEVYTVSYDSVSGIGDLTQFSKISNSWSSTVLDSGTVPYLDLECGNVDTDPNIGRQIYYLTADYDHTAEASIKRVYFRTEAGPTYGWHAQRMSDVTSNYAPLYYNRATVDNGCIAIGNLDQTSTVGAGADGEVYFGFNDDWNEAHVVGFFIYKPNPALPGYWYKTEKYTGSIKTNLPYDLVIADNYLTTAGNELVWPVYYQVLNLSKPAASDSYQNWPTYYPKHYFRSAAVGNVRPETTPGDVNDPWYGPETIAGGSLHNEDPGGAHFVPVNPQTAWEIHINNLTHWKAGDSSAAYYAVQTTVNYGVDNRYIRRIATGDLNNDGLDEFVIAAYGTLPTLTIYSWDSAANNFASQVLDTGRNYYDVKIVDVNGDGVPDILYAAEGEVGVFYVPKQGDINDDGKVNFADFAILAENWMK
ncbi:MAG: hypothetical protein A2Y10_10260 [Planctomycetes bacterium GWF2_41_51]|nr:MAG: hypothetical protein A2Y10_10260 [Planctomycetes bacterium GWF2_41_51]HBG27676.1 hypothetical protein [Phycisphaerales bacterium]